MAEKHHRSAPKTPQGNHQNSIHSRSSTDAPAISHIPHPALSHQVLDNPNNILALQQTVGNRVVARMLAQRDQTRTAQPADHNTATVQRAVINIPGVGEIDTQNYTEQELRIFKTTTNIRNKKQLLQQAINNREFKAAADPTAITGIGLAGNNLVKFLPVNLFQIDDRLPPRLDYGIGILVRDGIRGLTPLTVTVEDAGGNGGIVSVNGARSVNIDQSAKVSLKGLIQTSPGKAKALRVAVKRDTLLVLVSHRFTVAAAPTNWRISDSQSLTNKYFPEFDGHFYGMTVEEEWDSDSGVKQDLNRVSVDEKVELTQATGIYQGLQPQKREATSGTEEATLDDHAIEGSFIVGPGKKTLNQTHVYSDPRTGVQDEAIPKSGYQVTQEVALTNTQLLPNETIQTYTITTTKTGAAVTAEGVFSEAGQGQAQAAVQYRRRIPRQVVKKKNDFSNKRGKGRGRGRGRKRKLVVH